MTKTFTAQQIKLNAVDLLNQTADPSAGAGVSAAIGSFLLRSGTAQSWLKTAAADTAWTKLVQSFAWYSVVDYGAAGNGSTNDTAAVQAAIDDCQANGGGVVYFPHGTYAITQVTLNGTIGVQLLGAGPSSTIKWLWNAATTAGSMITLLGDASQTKIQWLRFDGSGLTNPNAGRDNHLLKVGTATGGVVETHVSHCIFTGMVANSGDGIHVLGATGDEVSRLWIESCVFDGCSRYGVLGRQGWEHGWIIDNYFTNCTTDIGLVASADVITHSVVCMGNEIVHTGTTALAIEINGADTALFTKLTFAENVIFGGFVSITDVSFVVWDGNIQTSGVFATANGAFRAFGAVSNLVLASGMIVRTVGATSGPCVEIIKATSSPTRLNFQALVLINEVASSGFIKMVDCTQFLIGASMFQALDAGSSTIYGVDIQALTVALNGCMIGTGNIFVADAGTFAACIRILANAVAISQASIIGNVGSDCVYGARFELTGGGTFTKSPVYMSNNMDATTGDYELVGTTQPIIIGANAGVQAQSILTGDGSPEGAVTAGIGSMYMQRNGGQATAFYYKESGTGNTGWIGVGGAPLVFGSGDMTTVATAVFLAPGWIATAPATELQIAITRPGTIRNLRVKPGVAGTGAATATYTVRKNGVDTTLTVGISNTVTTLTADTTNSFTVVAGDLISISCTKSAPVAVGQTNVTASMEVV